MLKLHYALGCLLALVMLGFTSCGHHHHYDNGHGPQIKKLPPGQAKKVTGSKSAKPYAQAKKY